MREKSSVRNNSGQTAIIVAFSLIILLGFLGIATDIGYLRYMKREMQKAADAGAVAGASDLGHPGSDYVAGARSLTAKNGFTHNLPDTNVEVNNPPTSGAYAGKSTYVEVIIHQDQPTFFMSVLGIHEAADQQARAVAGWPAESEGACIIALSPSTKHSTLVNGGSMLQVDCPIVNNSSSPDAFNASCLSTPTVIAESVCTAGGVTEKTIECTEPDPQIGCEPVEDPLASLPEPRADERPYPCEQGTDAGPCVINGGNATNCGDNDLILDPGVYCGGIKVSKTEMVTFNPGIYILNGGGFIVSDASVQGDGVMFYNTGDASNGYGNITFAKDVNGPNATLSAPSSDPSDFTYDPIYHGILFFQDHKNNRDAKISSGACTYFEGVLYFHYDNPAAPDETLLEYNGGENDCTAEEPTKMTIIGDVLHFQAGSTVFQGYPLDSSTSSSTGDISLVE